jgi:hypothetical protein
LKNNNLESKEEIKENIPTSDSFTKKNFNEKIISKVSQSFIRNMIITQSNFDINCVLQNKKFKNLIKVHKNHFNFIPRKKIDRIKRLEKTASFSFNHNISTKEKLIDSMKKINIDDINKKSELEDLEKNLEELLDKVRFKLGNQSNDPMMEKLLEKYSVMLIDRIEKKNIKK